MFSLLAIIAVALRITRRTIHDNSRLPATMGTSSPWTNNK